MTTVAYDGRYLAADTLAHREGVPSNMECRKIDICEGFAYAICGAYAAMLGSIIAWHRAGAKPDDFPQHGDGGVMIIEVATRRVWVVIKGVPYLDEEAAPLCAGSGRDVALGVLHCDLTAMEAVKIASKCDTHTNDTIDFIDLEFPASGVQRWDGMMPSKAYPMPVADEWKEMCGATEVPMRDLPPLYRYDREWARKPDTKAFVVVSDILGLRFVERDGPQMATFEVPLPGGDEDDVQRFVYHEITAKNCETSEAATAELRAKLSSYLVGQPDGIVHWRVKPEVESRYDILTDTTKWFGYARLCVVPSQAHQAFDTEGLKVKGVLRDPTHVGVEPRPGRLYSGEYFLADEKIIGCSNWGGGEWTHHPKCAHPDAPHNRKLAKIVAEAMQRAATTGVAVIETDEDGNQRLVDASEYYKGSHGGVIGRADICEHGYVRRTCTTCAPEYKQAIGEWVHHNGKKANGLA